MLEFWSIGKYVLGTFLACCLNNQIWYFYISIKKNPVIYYNINVITVFSSRLLLAFWWLNLNLCSIDQISALR